MKHVFARGCYTDVRQVTTAGLFTRKAKRLYNSSNVLRLTLLAATLVAGPAFAAGTSGTAAGDQAFTKLSKDGAHANIDIMTARVAIFEGDPARAKQEIASAQSALTSARNDDSVFMKSESEMKMQPNSPKTDTAAAAGTEKTAWIPVDVSMTLDEDYVANPAKSKSVDKANEQIKQGQQKSAMDTLRLADVGVNVMVEVLPLQTTIDGVNQAMQLIDGGKYYEANQALKHVQDGARFDDESANGKPKNAG